MSVNEVKSAKRILEILQFFAATKAPATLSQLSGALGFPKSSCLALLDTLEADGYAYQTAGRYYLTRRWLCESQIVADHDQLVARIRPVLAQLQEALSETIILAQRAGDRVVYLDVVEARRVLRFAAEVGQTKPLHASASGRALLGAMEVAQRQALVRELALPRHTDKTLTTADGLLDAVEKGVRQGWHVNRAEHQIDTVSVAAAVTLHGTALALVVGAPISRAGALADHIGQQLAAACRELVKDIEASRPLTDSSKE
jgi:IclR family acetate operon transcriptional repressor